MLTVNEVTEIFYLSDDFSKEFEVTYKKHLLKEDNDKKHRDKPNRLSNSEVMTILMAFHLSGMRNLKHYYLFYVCKHLTKEFPHLVSYCQFVELQQRVALPLVMFLKTCRMGDCTGISFIDSTALKVCHIKREHQNRVFDGIATKGKSTLGWFFGFKLHIIINDKGEIISFVITQGNVDDRYPPCPGLFRSVSQSISVIDPDSRAGGAFHLNVPNRYAPGGQYPNADVRSLSVVVHFPAFHTRATRYSLLVFFRVNQPDPIGPEVLQSQGHRQGRQVF